MPQMMPIYWLVIFVLVNLFVHFFLCFSYYNFFIFCSSSMEKVKGEGVSFLK